MQCFWRFQVRDLDSFTGLFFSFSLIILILLMELNREKKFACKFCNKRYPCGKSLGGHIRTHMNNENLAETEEDSAEIPIKNLISSKRFVESANYGLRENPKKTKRFSDSGKGSSSFKEMMICKECGKGFGSLKALCGHMSCHSEKHDLIMDSQSDTETSTPSKRRSKRVKYKTVLNNSDNIGNGSSSVQEQEDVAMCLMMLSRDSSGFKKRSSLNSVADSSDNNSVVLEDKSSSIDVRITIKNNNNVLKKKKKKSAEYDSSSENSDSGYFRNGPKKVESDESVDAFLKNIDFRRRYECLTCNKTFDSHRALGGHRASHTKVNDSNESMHDESCDNSLANDSFTAPMTDTKVTKSCSNGKSLRISKGSSSKAEKKVGSKKTKGHECPFCFRVFKSGQALGGHKRSHFVGGSDNRTFVIKQDMPALIDLNLPAAGFTSW